jgi:putative heme iron utilization protein
LVATCALHDAPRSILSTGRSSDAGPAHLRFINIDGGAMFKVFVGRDEKRELLADQLARFERMRDVETSAA